MLLDAGAVIHCKANVPQRVLALDRVRNPGDRLEWTAGGSSGGEAALVKMRACVFGIGTDVGGSITIPAMCNGVVGEKPSLGRVMGEGQEMGQFRGGGGCLWRL